MKILMEEKTERKNIRLIEEVFDNPKRKKSLGVYIDGKGGDIYNPKHSRKVQAIPLSKFALSTLELRPQTINLPIGNYKLIRDDITSHAGFYNRITDYERTNL